MKVKIIGMEKKAVIIEYLDENMQNQRCIVPEESLENGDTVRDELLSASIPYGVDWEFQLEGAVGNVTSERVAEEFRRRGIWTAEDVISNPKVVQGALMSLYGIDLAGVITVAKSLIHR